MTPIHKSAQHLLLPLLVLVLALLPSSLLAEAKAVIKGPESTDTGSLVVLTTEGSVGDNFKWIIPQQLQVITCDADQQLGFSSGKPGVFTFYLIAADKDAAIDYATHTVTVGKPTPPDEPDQPDEPNPVPDPEKISNDKKPNEPVIFPLLSQRIREAATQLESSPRPLQEAIIVYRSAIEDALALRPRGSRADWGPWKKAVSDILLLIESPSTLNKVMLLVADGIDGS